jgi:hypothetical protein
MPVALSPGGEADHSPPSSIEVKNGGAIPPLPNMSSWNSYYLIKHRENFIIIIIGLWALNFDRK